MMKAVSVQLAETDVVRLLLEFLERRQLFIAATSLERETAVINAHLNDELLFLRQLVMDGCWDDTLKFPAPLDTVEDFDSNTARFIVHKHKYLELLCLKNEAGQADIDALAVDSVVECLAQLEVLAPSREVYSELCLLLTLGSLNEHPEYSSWNPCAARARCFTHLLPLLTPFLPSDDHRQPSAQNDRLVQLLVKGLLYEQCTELCQQKALALETGAQIAGPQPQLLTSGQLNTSSDAGLLAWLDSLPLESFVSSFEQRPLAVRRVPLQRPELDVRWTDHMAVAPIKPNVFPYKDVPPRPSTAAMSRSCQAPQAGPLRPATAREPTMSRSLLPRQQAALSMMAQSLHQLVEGSSMDAPSPLLVSSPVSPRCDSGRSDDTQRSERSAARAVENIREQPQPEEKCAAVTRETTPRLDRVSRRAASARSLEIRQTSTENRNSADQSIKSEEIMMNHHYGNVVPRRSVPFQRQQSTGDSSSFSTPRQTSEDGSTSSRRAELNDRTPPPPPPPARPVSAASLITQPPLANTVVAVRTTPTPPSGALDPSTLDLRRRCSALFSTSPDKINFQAVTKLEDGQAVRSVSVHPSGRLYAVGANSKTLRICGYPQLQSLRVGDPLAAPVVIESLQNHHRGSIYSLAWNTAGTVLASGSNDRSVKLLSFDSSGASTGLATELQLHDGTVRCVMFADHQLVSAGAGNCSVILTDTESLLPIRTYIGHTDAILSSAMLSTTAFLTGGQEGVAHMWDTRSPSVIHSLRHNGFFAGLAAQRGQLASSHADGTVTLWDLRTLRPTVSGRPHMDECRDVKFSPDGQFLLSSSYDGTAALTQLGDSSSLSSVIVAKHSDKVIQVSWAPFAASFISGSADRSAIVWAVPSAD